MQLKNKLSSMLRFELLFCLFLICLLIVFYIVSLEYSAIARRSPYYVMVPLSIFLLIQITIELKKSWSEQQTAEDTGKKGLWQKVIEDSTIRKTLEIPLAAIILFLLIYLTGQVVGIALFLILFLRKYSQERWVLAISIGVITTIFLYLVFEKLLKILLERGVIYEYLISLMVK